MKLCVLRFFAYTPQKHSRIAFLGASALLLVSSSQCLTSSATGGVSVLRPRMTINNIYQQMKNAVNLNGAG